MQLLIELHFFLELTLHRQRLSIANHNFANFITKINLTL